MASIALKRPEQNRCRSSLFSELSEALYKAAEAAQQSAGAAGPMPGAAPEEESSDGPRKAKGRVVDAEIVDDDK